jgi:hypothetical protein
VDVLSALVAYLEAPEAVHPRQSSLHCPPIPSQLLARLDAPPCYARVYPSLPQGLAASREVVSLVSMKLLGAFAWSATTRLADRGDGIHGLFNELRIMDVGCRVGHRERDAFSVDHNVALRARFALICRILAGLLAPPGAGTLAESKEALCQSISSTLPS